MERVDGNKLNIGIITFHFPYNAGAVLQCFALQTFLKRINCNVKIINYRPWYHQNVYTPFRNPVQAAKEEYVRCRKAGIHGKAILRGIRFFLATFKSWTKCRDVLECDKKFNAFIKTYLNETRCYRNVKQLRRNPPKCDVYLCGSDQIWNPELTGGGYDSAYFLDFGASSVRKLSYAVGMQGCPQEDELLAEYLGKFEVLSFREQKSYASMKEKYGDKVHVDVDSTLLLESSDYEALMPKRMLETVPFIVTYVLPDYSGQIAIYQAEKLAKRIGIKVVHICGKKYEGAYGDVEVKCCGPEEFLWYIAHAEYVMTNSFHGTVFSVLFHKDFFAVPHTKTGNRIMDLLNKLELRERMLDGHEEPDIAPKPIEYERVDCLVKKYREISENHLKEWIR